MSFSHSSKTLRSGKTYSQNIPQKLSINAKNVANCSEQSDVEEINANNDRISRELIQEKIRANLEPLIAQI